MPNENVLITNPCRIATLMQTSGVSFGTSGARGRVTAMTDLICYAYTRAFLQYLDTQGQLQKGSNIAIAGDLRRSTGRIMNAVARAIKDSACRPVYCGHIPSPAIAYYGLQKKIPAIMVTGSHIPDDRNGIKFNTAEGEILKADEQGISHQLVNIEDGMFTQDGNFVRAEDYLGELNSEAEKSYLQRYLTFFNADTLEGMRVGLYEHSSVGRDIIYSLLTDLGAEVIRLGRSDHFIPVDTEAIREEDIVLARTWVQQHSLDAIVSTDGDADRPLVGTETGQWLRGDITGILCASYLNIDHIITPVSSNSAVEKCNRFQSVRRTKIGSPYVIAAMQDLVAGGALNVAGYEANGGFLLATSIEKEERTLEPLPTRDAVIVIVSLLADAKARRCTLTSLTKSLPARYTASDRVKDFPTKLSQQRLTQLADSDNRYQAIEAEFGDLCGKVQSVDTTDGLRIHFCNNEIIHLRPSGNAPEFRCYNEADTMQRAEALNQACIRKITGWRD